MSNEAVLRGARRTNDGLLFWNTFVIVVVSETPLTTAITRGQPLNWHVRLATLVKESVSVNCPAAASLACQPPRSEVTRNCDEVHGEVINADTFGCLSPLPKGAFGVEVPTTATINEATRAATTRIARRPRRRRRVAARASLIKSSRGSALSARVDCSVEVTVNRSYLPQL